MLLFSCGEMVAEKQVARYVGVSNYHVDDEGSRGVYVCMYMTRRIRVSSFGPRK